MEKLKNMTTENIYNTIIIIELICNTLIAYLFILNVKMIYFSIYYLIIYRYICINKYKIEK